MGNKSHPTTSLLILKPQQELAAQEYFTLNIRNIRYGNGYGDVRECVSFLRYAFLLHLEEKPHQIHDNQDKKDIFYHKTPLENIDPYLKSINRTFLIETTLYTTKHTAPEFTGQRLADPNGAKAR